MKRTWIVFTLLAFLTLNASAQDSNSDSNGVFVRVVDCGQGLCNIVRFPGNHFMVYDAGTKNNLIDQFGYDNSLLYNAGFCEIRDQLAEMDPLITGDQVTIDMLIISHAHEDHINAIPYIFSHYQVKNVLRTGLENNSNYFLKKRITDAIANEQATTGCNDMVIDDYFASDESERIDFCDVDDDGNADFDVLFGLGNLPDGSNDENTTSIVIRIEFGNKSILFAGDSCGKAQDMMVVNHTPIGSDILIPPHHGSNNDMNDEWFKMVDPDYVIFSAGRFGNMSGGVFHWWQHPRQVRVDLFTAPKPTGCGVDPLNIFSTDWGDNEGNLEWNVGRGDGDGPGDDGVDIFLDFDDSVDPVVVWERNDIDPHTRS
ncbi:MAG: MBL fold metallo-hydrolase [bacterium]|nr:MBL fold metallo-hydrolase [bacterium]